MILALHSTTDQWLGLWWEQALYPTGHTTAFVSVLLHVKVLAQGPACLRCTGNGCKGISS